MGRSRPLVRSLLTLALVGSVGLGAGRGRAQPPSDPAPSPASRGAPGPLPPGIELGAPVTVENLAVLPVTSREQRELGPLTTLEAALERGDAEVREIGAGDAVAAPAAPAAPNPAAHHRPQVQQRASPGGSAQVNQLVIANEGDKPIYVLAGTVVKGGKQDRQIGQDVIIDRGETAKVEAFCVERGRWNASRQGRSTGGRFGSVGQLAGREVRAAAQYERNQSEVWKKVGDVNRAHGKRSTSGTLAATLDAADVRRRRDAIAERVREALDGASVVGLAYAVDGEVQGVRWFASRGVFELFRDSLARAAALDALTAQARHGRRRAPAVSRRDVLRFVASVERAAAEERDRDTGAANVNAYRRGRGGSRSKTRLKGRDAAPAAEVSTDYTAH